MENTATQAEPARVVCYVCRKYFDESQTTLTEFDGHICHECSGEKPSTSNTDPSAGSALAVKARKKATGLRDEAKPVRPAELLMAPALEIATTVACIGIMAFQLYTTYGRGEDKPVLRSQLPEDIATYCLDVLSSMEHKAVAMTLEAVEQACFPPLTITEDEFGVLVTTPDPDFFGYSEILIEPQIATITVTE
ncbi:MAG: hypothetical protein AAF756_11270 [Pseudomonadota bacterium]